MGINCGSQVTICDVPIHLDTYEGCTHACAYCFVKRKRGIDAVKPLHCAGALRSFIEGKRTQETAWCDWSIPLHWGAMSDPFQPCEEQHRCSLECLEVLAETRYPFIVSTKGRLCLRDPWLSAIGRCNCVVQFSAVCPKYDKLEPGAPPFDERVEMCRRMSQVAKRVIVRIQPYLREVRDDVLAALPRLRDAGVHGVVIEGMKRVTKRPGLVKRGGDMVYPTAALADDFRRIRDRAHGCGLRFYCGENRLRKMGDAWCCCGIDGMPGFKGNSFNALHLIKGDRAAAPTRAMSAKGTAWPFKCMMQDGLSMKILRENSFAGAMLHFVDKYRRSGTLD